MSEFSNYLEAKLDELVTANRILGRENVCDAFGHVSIRHPDRNDRYFLSRLLLGNNKWRTLRYIHTHT